MLVSESRARKATLANSGIHIVIRDGSLDDAETFRNFSVGFTQGRAQFNFIVRKIFLH